MESVLHNFDISRGIAHLEARGLSICFKSYSENCAGLDIMGIGFNDQTGIVYIALENGISICSFLGNDVFYIVTDIEDGSEFECSTYDMALKHRF